MSELINQSFLTSPPKSSCSNEADEIHFSLSFKFFKQWSQLLPLPPRMDTFTPCIVLPLANNYLPTLPGAPDKGLVSL